MSNLIKLLFVSALICGQTSQAEITAKFKRDAVFEQAYGTQYVAGRCGDNIKRLVALWQKSGRNLQGVSVLTIENRGGSVFGMVNAERARDFIRDQPAVNERNWYHHVIAVDKDGFVYDFDFMTKPYVLNFKRYVYYMFLDEPECKQSAYGQFCAGAKEKLKHYKVEWYHAKDMITKESPKPFHSGNLMDALRRASHLGR